eukprot:ctg_769.g385
MPVRRRIRSAFRRTCADCTAVRSKTTPAAAASSRQQPPPPPHPLVSFPLHHAHRVHHRVAQVGHGRRAGAVGCTIRTVRVQLLPARECARLRGVLLETAGVADTARRATIGGPRGVRLLCVLAVVRAERGGHLRPRVPAASGVHAVGQGAGGVSDGVPRGRVAGVRSGRSDRALSVFIRSHSQVPKPRRGRHYHAHRARPGRDQGHPAPDHRQRVGARRQAGSAGGQEQRSVVAEQDVLQNRQAAEQLLQLGVMRWC